jgi:hypothetical protein
VPTVPWHAYWHVVAGVSQDPVVLQVSICVSLEQACVPGTHEPPHTPGGVPTVPRHAYWHGLAACTQTPFVLQVSSVVSL